ncbi:MAG TPA: S41 family peptidase [Edaphocola sp.]|nr:S41 family peptidase [Edaphocola sp.]
MNNTGFFKKLLLGLGLTVAWGTSHAQFNNAEADKFFEISKNLEIYTNVLKELNTFYVDPINPGKMTKTGLDAMLNELDPYTNFITEAQAEQFEMEFSGRYGGMGVSIYADSTGRILVAEVKENGPFDKAGFKPGDVILSIDGNDVSKRSEEEVGLLLKGAPGSKVKVTVKKPKNGETISKEITRAEIIVPPVAYSGFIDDKQQIAYVLLTQFTPHCSRDVKAALDSLKNVAQNGLQGVVLDLRGNPGGLITEAVNVCNLFVEKGVEIVRTKSKHKEWDKQYATTSEPWDAKIPLAILINSNSASASEIVSGALQDMDRAVVIGSKSFGKGLVQVVRPVGYNSRLKVTTAKYYTPSGRCIQAMDYANRNEDGSVASVPDSLKKAFKTAAGRIVYDGGGIEPDVKIESEYLSLLSAKLLKDLVIFDYVTEYFYKHPSIAPAKQFKFTDADYQDFQKWLSSKNFKYETRNEYILDALKKNAEEENNFSRIQKEYDMLLQKLNQEKKKDFENYAAEIKDIIATEIVSRYYYQKGQIEYQLSKENAALKKAVALLSTDKAEYNKILKKK